MCIKLKMCKVSSLEVEPFCEGGKFGNHIKIDGKEDSARQFDTAREADEFLLNTLRGKILEVVKGDDTVRLKLEWEKKGSCVQLDLSMGKKTRR